MAYKNIPVDEAIYEVLAQMKESMNAKSFNELLFTLVMKNRKKTMLGCAKWLSQPERDEADR